MNTQENNRLIAEFEGYETYEMNGYINVHYSDDNIRTIVDTHYHTSWDWLMPVVEEIDHLEYESERLDKINQALVTKVIKDVYNAVVEFIKWYNENK